MAKPKQTRGSTHRRLRANRPNGHPALWGGAAAGTARSMMPSRSASFARGTSVRCRTRVCRGAACDHTIPFRLLIRPFPPWAAPARAPPACDSHNLFVAVLRTVTTIVAAGSSAAAGAPRRRPSHFALRAAASQRAAQCAAAAQCTRASATAAAATLASLSASTPASTPPTLHADLFWSRGERGTPAPASAPAPAPALVAPRHQRQLRLRLVDWTAAAPADNWRNRSASGSPDNLWLRLGLRLWPSLRDPAPLRSSAALRTASRLLVLQQVCDGWLHTPPRHLERRPARVVAQGRWSHHVHAGVHDLQHAFRVVSLHSTEKLLLQPAFGPRQHSARSGRRGSPQLARRRA